MKVKHVKLSWISDHQWPACSDEAAQSAEHEAAPGIYLSARPIWVNAGEGNMLCDTGDDQGSNKQVVM